MSNITKGSRVLEKNCERLGPGVVLRQCGAGGIQRTGCEPAGTDVSIVLWADGAFTSRVPTEDLVLDLTPFSREIARVTAHDPCIMMGCVHEYGHQGLHEYQ